MQQNHKGKQKKKTLVNVLDNEQLIIMPTMPQEQLKQYITKYSDSENTAKLAKDKNFEGLSAALVHGMAYSMVAPNDMFNGKFTSKNSTNDYTLNGKPLHNHSLKMKKITGQVTGKNIKHKINTKLGIQSNEKVFLFNSGFWVVIGNIRNVDTISLSNRLAKSISTIGVSTSGLIYSHESIVYHRVLLEFIQEHILATSLSTGVDTILDHISIYDIDTLILGLITCLSPDGYDSILLCKNQYGKDNEQIECDYVARTKLQPASLTYTSKPLDNKQKIIMGAGKGEVTLEDVALYKENMVVNTNIKIANDITLSLTVPTISKYLSMGETWILRLNDMVNSALGKDSEDEERDVFLQELNNSLALNWYNHWVTDIDLGDGSFITGDSDIVEALDSLSADDDIGLEILEKIHKFIDVHSISIAGVATFTCPNCKKDLDEKSRKEAFEYIIPINTLQLFLAISTRN